MYCIKNVPAKRPNINAKPKNPKYLAAAPSSIPAAVVAILIKKLPTQT